MHHVTNGRGTPYKSATANGNRKTVKERFREFAKEWQVRMITNDETIALRVTVIGGQRHAADYHRPSAAVPALASGQGRGTFTGLAKTQE